MAATHPQTTRNLTGTGRAAAPTRPYIVVRFRPKLSVLIQRVCSYLTYNPGARAIHTVSRLVPPRATPGFTHPTAGSSLQPSS